MLFRLKRPGYKAITYESGAAPAKKAFKGPREIYAPPSGKFSERAGAYAAGRKSYPVCIHAPPWPLCVMGGGHTLAAHHTASLWEETIGVVDC